MDGQHELLKQLIHNYVQASNLLVQHLVEDVNRQNLENWNQKYKNALESTRFHHIERKLTKWCETAGKNKTQKDALKGILSYSPSFPDMPVPRPRVLTPNFITMKQFGYEYPEPASRQRHKRPRSDILQQSLDHADINLADTEEVYEPPTSQSTSQSLTLNYSNNDRDPPHTFNVLLQHQGSFMGTLNPMQSRIQSDLPDLSSISSEFQADHDLQVNTGSTTTTSASFQAGTLQSRMQSDLPDLSSISSEFQADHDLQVNTGSTTTTSASFQAGTLQSRMQSDLPDLGSILSEFQADHYLQVNIESTSLSASSQGAAYIEASNELNPVHENNTGTEVNTGRDGSTENAYEIRRVSNTISLETAENNFEDETMSSTDEDCDDDGEINEFNAHQHQEVDSEHNQLHVAEGIQNQQPEEYSGSIQDTYGQEGTDNSDTGGQIPVEATGAAGGSPSEVEPNLMKVMEVLFDPPYTLYGNF